MVSGFRFFIYLNEHLPRHVHIIRGGARAGSEGNNEYYRGKLFNANR